MKATPLTAEAVGQFLPDLITNGKYTQALHETVVAYRANRRAGTHSTLTKGTVSYSGKKPWRQKGTGNARAGYKSSPVWRKGGVVFGPHPRDYSKTTNKKVRLLALRKALSARILGGHVHLVDVIDLKAPKTKELVGLFDAVGLFGSVLLVLPKHDENILRAARNVPDLEVVSGVDVNAEQLLRHEYIVVTESSLNQITARLADKE